MAFVSLSNNRSTNRAVKTTQAVNTTNGVSTTNTQINAAFSGNMHNLNDVVICAFLASQPNSPQLEHENLEQIHPDDIEEIDLRWQMTILTMRAKRFLKKTGRKLNVNGNETLGFNMSKVKCYNCHKRGQFAKEYRASRNQDTYHMESTRRNVPVETPTSTSLVSCDGNFMPPKSDLSYTGLDEFADKPVAENTNSFKEETKAIRKNSDALIIEELVSDDEDENLIDESEALLRVPRKNNMYSVDLKNIVPEGGFTCLFAKATSDESKLWHRRLGQLNFKTMNKLFKGNLNKDSEENLNIRFSENTPNVLGSRPYWLFDIDALSRIMNYEPIVAGTQSNGFASTKACDNAGQARKETYSIKDYILLPLWTADPPFSQNPNSSQDDKFKPLSDDGKKID
uniref:Ribonuclease H-like domain-containing protein n=1 Tax=Tanacetum cinerariifolium TaxID=118510 RepID=A0A6L2M646_TANCI|nr:ribonuclease H-like domain-containing protein [Tanacetum cinerariifolium]